MKFQENIMEKGAIMTFEKQAIKKGIIPDLISVILVYSYSLIPTKIITGLTFDKFTYLSIYVILVSLAVQFIIAPIFDHLTFSKMSNRLDKFMHEESTCTERTHLLEDLMLYPLYTAVITFGYFLLGSILVFLYYKYVMKLILTACILSLCECIFGSIFTSLYAYSYCNKIVTNYAAEIVKKGIDKKYVAQKNYFGVSFIAQKRIYIAIPALLSTFLTNIAFIAGYMQTPASTLTPWLPVTSQIMNVGITCLLNTIVQIAMILGLYRRISYNSQKMTSILEEINSSETTEIKYLNTDLEDEFAYNHYLANEMLSLLQDTLLHFESIGHQLNASSLNLSQISTETNSTYLQQSSSTKEIVTSMKETTEKSHQTIENISEVYDLARKTEIDVRKGQKILEQYHENINSINSHNNKTSIGIQSLTDKIRNIWEVVTIINSIADQTKIIAFNAELEANGIKEKSGNFKNVSNEIRRLANGTMDSTREIKERISEIQSKADTLKTALENTKPHILSSIKTSEELTKNFSMIQDSAKTNSISASKIQNIIQKQSARFDARNATLEQINSKLQSYDDDTKNISTSSKNLQLSAQELENVTKNGDTSNEY